MSLAERALVTEEVFFEAVSERLLRQASRFFLGTDQGSGGFSPYRPGSLVLDLEKEELFRLEVPAAEDRAFHLDMAEGGAEAWIRTKVTPLAKARGYELREARCLSLLAEKSSTATQLADHLSKKYLKRAAGGSDVYKTKNCLAVMSRWGHVWRSPVTGIWHNSRIDRIPADVLSRVQGRP